MSDKTAIVSGGQSAKKTGGTPSPGWRSGSAKKQFAGWHEKTVIGAAPGPDVRLGDLGVGARAQFELFQRQSCGPQT